MCVITAYGVPCLVAGCRGSGAGQQAMCPGARDYMCVITAYGVQCLVAGCRASGAGQ